MQIDGIRLLRFTMRELGIPEHKVRNAIRYLQDENARIVSKGAADAAIRDAAKEQRALKWAEYRLRQMYSDKRPNSYRCVCPTSSIKNVLSVGGVRLWTAYAVSGLDVDETTGKLLPNLYPGTIYVHRDVDLDACTTL